MKKLCSCLLAVLIAIFCALPAFAANEPDISSQSALLIDLETGKPVYNKNEHQKITMGTLSKIMVALLVLENVPDLSVSVPVTDVSFYNAQNKGNNGPSAFLKRGEILSADDMLSLLMVSSGLDASNALGEFVAGSLTEFVAMLNRRAAELGCTDTNFVNASGAENSLQYTTAYDMSLILGAALKNEHFMQYASLIRTYVKSEGFEAHSPTTSNALVKSASEEYYYSAAKGVAYTQLNDNTNSIATVISKGGAQYMCIVMGGGVNAANLKECFLDAKALGTWVFSAFKTVSLASKDSIIDSTPIEFCEQTDKLNLVAVDDAFASVLSSVDESAIKTEIELYETTPLKAPVTKGQVLGKALFYSAEGDFLGEVELAAALSLEFSQKIADEQARLEFMRSPIFFVIVGVIAVVIIAIITIAVILYKRNKVDGF